MLEKPGLLILPWSSPAGLGLVGAEVFAWVRPIRAAVDNADLGFAGWAGRGVSWLALLQGKSMQVFESPDASHLMTIHRPFGPFRTWNVADAENHRIGGSYRQILLDGTGQVFCQLDEEQPQRFITSAGTKLGSWEWLEDGSGRLTFAEPINPFVRMNLLAKILALPPLPHR